MIRIGEPALRSETAELDSTLTGNWQLVKVSSRWWLLRRTRPQFLAGFTESDSPTLRPFYRCLQRDRIKQVINTAVGATKLRDAQPHRVTFSRSDRVRAAALEGRGSPKRIDRRRGGKNGSRYAARITYLPCATLCHYGGPVAAEPKMQFR